MTKGGRNTKIHAVVDAIGNPIFVYLTKGSTSDTKVGPILVRNARIQEGTVVMGDRAYVSSEIFEGIVSRGGTVCVPPKGNTANPWEYDEYQYHERSAVECFFNKIKNFRGIATRYAKYACTFLAFVLLACNFVLFK